MNTKCHLRFHTSCFYRSFSMPYHDAKRFTAQKRQCKTKLSWPFGKYIKHPWSCSNLQLAINFSFHLFFIKNLHILDHTGLKKNSCAHELHVFFIFSVETVTISVLRLRQRLPAYWRLHLTFIQPPFQRGEIYLPKRKNKLLI